MDMSKLSLGGFGRRKEPDDDSNGLPKEIQDQLDEVERMENEMDLVFNSKKKTEKYPSWKDLTTEKLPPWKDGFKYDFKTTTKWPPLDWHPITHTESTDSFLKEFNRKWDEEHTQVDTSIHHRSSYTPVYVWLPIIVLLPIIIIFVVLLIIFLARRSNRPLGATVLPNGRIIGPGPVPRNQQIPMMPPGQGGAVPTNVPYSDNFNRPYNDEPPPYPTDADLQVNNSGIGFRNEVAPVPSAPPPYSDNYSEPVESLNFGLNKEKAGQGTRNADEKESVKYVDEKSVHK